MGTRRERTSEEKLAAVMEGLKGRSISEICTEYGISNGLYYKWRDQALEGLRRGLQDKRERKNKSPQAERNRLLKIIGEQQVIIDFQKKLCDAL